MANTRSVTVTYDGTQFGSSETGQVLAFNRASMPDERFDPAGAYKGAADGGDLRLFVGGVGVPLEIVAIAYDSALGAGDGTFVAWARVDTTAATALDLEWQYGDAELTQPAATDPLGSRAVWSDYAFVSHNGQTDSTGNHMITLGGSPSTTTGPFGDSAGAISLNGSTQYGQATVSLGANSYPWVAQVWVSATSGEITGRGAILGAFDDSNAADWYSVMQDGGEVWIHERQGGNIVAANAAIPGSLTAGVWARVTGVLIDTAHRVGYLNGGSKTANDTVPFNAAFNMDRFSFGRWDDSTPSDYFGGSLAEMWVRLSQPSDGRIATEYNNQNPATAATYVTVGTPTSIGGGGSTYTLTASAGSYAMTGQSAGLAATRKLTAATGIYTLSGQAASLKAGRKVSAGAGTYTLSGAAAGLKAARKLTAATGSYALTGSDAVLDYTSTGPLTYTLAAEAGSYSLSGQAASLKATRTLSAGAGSYSLTGQAAGLAYGRRLAAGAGAYTLTGKVVTLKVARVLTAEAGTYALSGSAAGLDYSGFVRPTYAARWAAAEAWTATAANEGWSRKAAPESWARRGV